METIILPVVKNGVVVEHREYRIIPKNLRAKRQEGEPFADYQKRRRRDNAKTAGHLRGTLFHYSYHQGTIIDTGKHRPDGKKIYACMNNCGRR
jgi:hypothetical protein